MTSSAAIPEGPGSASGAPNLPYGFAGTFTSRYIDTGDVRLHAVTGGEGPPLLLVHGWPISRSSVLRSLSRSMIPVVPSGRPESVVISQQKLPGHRRGVGAVTTSKPPGHGRRSSLTPAESSLAKTSRNLFLVSRGQT
jgi:pimeloyl-ACP methyl ester carboxylesterase